MPKEAVSVTFDTASSIIIVLYNHNLYVTYTY